MRLPTLLILIGCISLQFPTLVQASPFEEGKEARAKFNRVDSDSTEGWPSTHAILVHSPQEAAQQRGYSLPLLDRPEFPSTSSAGHDTYYNQLHLAQHESIIKAQREMIRKQRMKNQCNQLFKDQQDLARKMQVLERAGKNDFINDLRKKSDDLQTLIASKCRIRR